MNESEKRVISDHLDELTAAIETLRVAIASLAEQVPDRAQLLDTYAEGIAHIHAISLGSGRSDRYLDQMEKHAAATRVFLSLQK